ncbi:Biopolymer transport protein ExbB [compost metagenome]
MRATAIVLLAMSLLSWIVILTKVLDLFRLRQMARHAELRFWHSPDFDQALAALGVNEGNPFRTLALSGHAAMQYQPVSPQQLHNQLASADWLTRSMKISTDELVARMQSGLAILASVGSTAPFVGLFGTVWGIYHALIGIGMSGIPTVDKVAGPVGEALIMTAFGLAVAIPAVLGYNALNRGNKVVIGKLNRFAFELHGYFLTGACVRSISRPANDGIVRLAGRN